MNEHLEDALDSYLGDRSVLRGKTRDLVEKPSNDTESKPESKLWKLIDKWKKQGLSPKFEICVKMLKLWGIEE